MTNNNGNYERLPVVAYALLKPDTDISSMIQDIHDNHDEYESMFNGKWNLWYADHYWHYLRTGLDDQNYLITCLTPYYEKFQKLIDYSRALSYRFNVYMYDKLFAIIGFNSNSYFFIPNPDSYLEIEQIPDYSDFTINELRGKFISSTSSNSLVSQDLSNVKPSSIKHNIADKQSRLDKLKQDLDDVKQCKNAELAKLQAEIDAKKAELDKRKTDLMSILEAKKAEMAAEMEKLENQLFLLDTEIYGIRCFLGETVKFIHIRKGDPAPVDQPILLFQKMHFLDEDMGKLCSLYNFDFSDIKLFEQFLQHSDEALDLFCPSTKCVSLVKISRTGMYYGHDNLAYNILQEYKVYHGDTVGILIRNGDNLYIGWTDDEKVNIRENMFYVPGVKVVEEEDIRPEEVSNKYTVASRYFIFSILQGCLENSKLIELPEGNYNFTVPSKYIIYSSAENWITDNKYGSFSDMVNKYHKGVQHKEGDMIISTQSLCANGNTYMWGHVKNDRGIGYADRTHDVHYSDNTIYRLNKVVITKSYDLWYLDENGSKYRITLTPNLRDDTDFDSWVKEYIDDWEKRNPKRTFIELTPNFRYSHYVSLRKSDAWDRYEPYIVPPKANFEVDDDEFINLTFLIPSSLGA